MLSRYPQHTQIFTFSSVPISTPPLNTFLLCPMPPSIWSIEPTSPDRTTRSPPKLSWSTKPSRQSVFKQTCGSQSGKYIALKSLDMTERLHFHFSLSCIGEGNGNPLQCSCLENPRDRGAWWTAVYGVAQSRTRLKRLSNSRSKSFRSPVCAGSQLSEQRAGYAPP